MRDREEIRSDGEEAACSIKMEWFIRANLEKM
jgi:hypothetical protein